MISEITPPSSEDEAIQTLAYQLWVERGGPIGDDWTDWFMAENKLKLKEGGEF